MGPSMLVFPRIPTAEVIMDRATRFLYMGSLACWSLLAVLPSGVQADGSPLRVAKAHAIVVGISTYPDPAIHPRRHAEADAKALYDLITSKDHVAAMPENVKLLLGTKDERRPSETATRENILSALDQLIGRAGPDDLVIFAFFGQGCPLGEEAGFFATDSTVKERLQTAVARTAVGERLRQLKSPRLFAVIDAHLTDFAGADRVGDGVGPAALARVFSPAHKDASENPLNARVVFLASRGQGATVELDEHSLFAHTLLKGMKGEADRGGYEPDGLVVVDELFKYVGDEVPRGARVHGKTGAEKAQSPLLLIGRNADYPLSRNPLAAAGAAQRLARFLEIAKGPEVSRDLAAEGERLLARMPRWKAQQELRKNYQHLADGMLALPEFLKRRAQVLKDCELDDGEAQKYSGNVSHALRTLVFAHYSEPRAGMMAGWAISALYREADESVPADLAERLEKVKELKIGGNEVGSLLIDARKRLGRREGFESPKDAELSLKRLMPRLDKNSEYLDAESVRQRKSEFSGYTGVGMQIRRDSARDLIRVITPLKDSPAYKTGVKAGDWIVQIIREVDSDGAPLDKPEVIPGVGLSTDEAVKKILGKPGTKVKITVEREGDQDHRCGTQGVKGT